METPTKPREGIEPVPAAVTPAALKAGPQPPPVGQADAPTNPSPAPKDPKKRKRPFRIPKKPRHAAAMRNLDRTGKLPKMTKEEMRKRREAITILRYDMNFTEQEIANHLKMSIGRVCEHLHEINKEFNRPLDPTARNRFIQEHDRHYRYVVGKLYQDINQTMRGSRERSSYLASLVTTLAQHERFMAQIGLVKEAPIQLEVKHEEKIPEEALLRFAEDIISRKRPKS